MLDFELLLVPLIVPKLILSLLFVVSVLDMCARR